MLSTIFALTLLLLGGAQTQQQLSQDDSQCQGTYWITIILKP